MSNKTSENIHEENKEHLRNPGKVILVEITSGIVVEGNEICADLCVAVRYRLAVTGGLLVLPWTVAVAGFILFTGAVAASRVVASPTTNIAPADMLCTLKTCHFVILVYSTLSV